MKTTIFFLIFLACSVYAQSPSGYISYGEVQSMGLGGPIGHDYNAVLFFDKTRSLYITCKDSLEPVPIRGHINASSGINRSFRPVSTNEKGFLYYNNLKTGELKSHDLGFKYVNETTPKLEWKITSESKSIGNLEAFKATTEFRGRQYTAWFTKEIPLPFGPWKLQGLPGMILEAYDTDKEIYWYFKAIEFPSDKVDRYLKPIKNETNKWITLNEFKAFLLKAHKNSQIAGRMVGESVGIKTIDEKTSMLNTYIEDFEVENQKK